MATKQKESLTTKDLFKDNSIYKLKPSKEIIQVSNSKIGLFNTCYLQFYFRYLTDYPVKPVVWPATLLGEALHKTVELSVQFMNNNQNLDLKKLKKGIKDNVSSFKEVYDIMLEEKKDEFKKSRGYDYDEFIDKGEKYRTLLTNFVVSYFFDYVVHTELEFKAMWTKDVELIGYIDLLAFDENENYSIFDLKVTKDSFKYYFVDWENNFQSQIYEFLTNEKYNKWSEYFSFIVCNHEDKTLFFKQKILAKPENESIYFKNLGFAIDNLVSFVREPKIIKDFNHTTATCKWCNYKDICPFNKNK